MSYLSTDEAYDYNTLACWYQNSIDETQPPIWTDEHLEELLKDFYIIPKDTPTADVVPKSEVTREIFEELRKEIIDARNSNFNAIKERVEKHNVIRYEDSFCMYCDGKISALDGIAYFIDELEKKYTEDK